MRAIWLSLRIQESFLEEVILKLCLEEWEKMFAGWANIQVLASPPTWSVDGKNDIVKLCFPYLY